MKKRICYFVLLTAITPACRTLVALVVKNPSANAGDIRDMGLIPGSGRSSGEGIATHSSVLAWRIWGTEEPGGLLSRGSHRVWHDWSVLAAAADLWYHTFIFYVCESASVLEISSLVSGFCLFSYNSTCKWKHILWYDCHSLGICLLLSDWLHSCDRL